MKQKILGFSLLATVLIGIFLIANTHSSDHDNTKQPAMEGGHSSHGSHSPSHGAGGDSHQNHPSSKSVGPVSFGSAAGTSTNNSELLLVLDPVKLQPNRSGALSFKLLNSSGETVDDLQVSHQKKLHLIVIRRDGKEFHHVHPRLNTDGSWSTDIKLKKPGSYRLFADFKYRDKTHTLAADLAVDGNATYSDIKPSVKTAKIGPYRVKLSATDLKAGADNTLNFTVTKGSKPVQLENYLGAGGHLVALRSSDLAFLHLHASQNTQSLAFSGQFPTPGSYMLFLQFKTAGSVRTAPLTVEVR